MKKLYKYLIAIALVCSSIIAKAQNDGIGLTLLPQMPYVNYYNPGIRMPYNGMAGIAFSNINVSLFNSSIKSSNIYGENKEVIDAVKLVNSLGDDNSLNFNFSMDLVNVGFRVKNLFFNIDWRLRVNEEFSYSKDLIGFFVLGNANYMGYDNPCDFSLGLDASVFHEFSVSAQYNVNDKLTVGIRPKVLSGVANVMIDNKDTKIFTDPQSFAITADVDLDMKMASLLEGNPQKFKDISKMIDSITSSDMLDFGENLGFAVDFGASYTFNEHFGVAAGIYDLGYIKWTDAKVKRIDKDVVNVNDALLTDYHDITTFDFDYQTIVEDLVDEVWGEGLIEKGPDYKTYLKTRLMVQGYYEFHPMLRATAVGQMYYVKGKVHPALTIAYSGNFWNHINLTLNYTLSKYTGSGFGAGIGFHFGPFNLYAVSDNIFGLFKVNTSAYEFVSNYKQTNARVGIVFAW